MRTVRSRLTAGLCAFFAAVTSANSASPWFDAVRADAYLRSLVAAGSFRGSVLVSVHGKLVFEKGYGFADEEWKAYNSPSTKFRIASITKQFTAACILLLQEHGKLRVSDPVSMYVDDLPDGWRNITIHQLLTHTSGIPNYAAMPRVEGELNRTGATPRELIQVAASKPLEFKPGTRLSYTNTGYLLLGLIIEKVSGMSYAEFVNENIFTPLAMKGSGYDSAFEILDERASGYAVRDGVVGNADFIDMSIPNASGSLYSTVEDLQRWSEALTKPGVLLTGHSLQDMFSPYPEAVLGDQHYGYGIVIAHRFGKLLYYHGGGIKGFNSVIQRYPNEGVCIVILENLDPAAPWDVADHLAGFLWNPDRAAQ